MGLTKIGTDGFKDDAVTSDKVANSINSAIAANTAKTSLEDESVTLAKLEHGTPSNDGKFLRANNGADPSFESLPASGLSNVVEDTSPQLGGSLDTNGQLINFGDSNSSTANRLNFGVGNDFNIYHDGTHSYVRDSGAGNLQIVSNQTNIQDADLSHYQAKFIDGGAVELYNNGSKKFETTSTGINVTGHSIVSQPRAMFYGVANTAGYAGWKTVRFKVQQDRNSITASNNLSRFTPTVAGWYLCIFQHTHGNGGHNSYYLRIRKNASTNYAYIEPYDGMHGNCSTMIDLNGSSDFVEFSTFHSNTAHDCEDSTITNMRMVFMTTT
jgi:hypothetical protein